MVDKLVIDQIRESSDIVEVIGNEINLSRKGSAYFGLCPWHDDTRPSLRVDPKRQSYRCFVCDIGGDVFSYLMKTKNLSFPESIAILGDRVGIPIAVSEQDKKEYSEREILYQALEESSRIFQDELRKNKHVLDYLVEERKLTEETIDYWQIGYSPDNWKFLTRKLPDNRIPTFLNAGIIGQSAEGSYYDRFKNRIVFPIRDLSGRIVGFAGRTIDPNNLVKYVNSPETPVYKKSSILFGLPEAEKSIREQKKAIVFEGYLDVIMAHQFGLSNVIGVGGIAFTEEHTRIMNSRFSEIPLVLCYDGDKGGRKGAFNSSKQLLGRVDARICILKQGMDPDDVLVKEGKESLEKMLEKTEPLFDFYMQETLYNLDLRNPIHAANFLKRVGSDLKVVPPNIVGVYIDHISKRTNLSKESIEAVLSNSVYSRLKSSEHKGRGFYETVLICGLMEFPDALAYFEKRLKPDLFTSPERRAVYNYLVDTRGDSPLFAGPLFNSHLYDVLEVINEKSPGLNQEKLIKLLSNKTKRKESSLSNLEEALVEIYIHKALDHIRKARKKGCTLLQIETAMEDLNKSL